MENQYFFVGEVKITLAEARVMSLNVCGLQRKQMCHVLGISDSTLNQRIKKIFLKTNTPSNVLLALFSTTKGFDGNGNLNGQYLFDGIDNVPW